MKAFVFPGQGAHRNLVGQEEEVKADDAHQHGHSDDGVVAHRTVHRFAVVVIAFHKFQCLLAKVNNNLGIGIVVVVFSVVLFVKITIV